MSPKGVEHKVRAFIVASAVVCEPINVAERR